MTTDALFQIFSAAKKVADIAYEFWTPQTGENSRPWLEDRRHQGVNAFYNQTKAGLFLEVYYGIPGQIWTPWGQWDCWGSGSSSGHEEMEQFLQRINAELFRKLHVTDMGEYGPIYSIPSLEGFDLPAPMVHAQANYMEYEDANRQWEEMERRFQSS